MVRVRVSSPTPWEPRVGYSRAVRVGNHVWLSGTTATSSDGRIVGGKDPRAQARQAFENVERALRAAGASLCDVVRTRLFITRIKDWKVVGEVHREFFGSLRPASTLVAVVRLVDPRLLVEVEVDAVAGSGRKVRDRAVAPPEGHAIARRTSTSRRDSRDSAR